MEKILTQQPFTNHSYTAAKVQNKQKQQTTKPPYRSRNAQHADRERERVRETEREKERKKKEARVIVF